MKHKKENKKAIKSLKKIHRMNENEKCHTVIETKRMYMCLQNTD